jgi:ubiquinone biosynthesis protein
MSALAIFAVRLSLGPIREIEAALGASVDEIYDEFDEVALASASVAQVHAAKLKDGRDVVVKVLRPGIDDRIRRDVEVLNSLARLAHRLLPDAQRLRPKEMVGEFEKTIFNELDLMREAANGSQLRRNFQGSPDLYVPEMMWPYCHRDCITMERVWGIPIGDEAQLDEANVNRRRLAERGIEIFYTQVFRDNFFHADMHPGNILVNATDPEEPTFIVLDFGIVGILPAEHLFYLGENFLALFNQDYNRIAKLHVEAGWLPRDTRIDDLEGAVRAVCEPHFSRPLSEISLGVVLVQLLNVARRYELTVQPELVLLQKTLLNIEGMGRTLDPDIDIWEVASPILTDIIQRRYGLEAAAKELRSKLPGLLAKAPELPTLVHDYLTHSDARQTELAAHHKRIEALTDAGNKRIARALLAVGAAAIGAWTAGANVSAPGQWSWFTISIFGVAALLGVAALRTRARES